MTQAKIQGWLNYWRAAKMVAVEEIQSIEDMAEARKWCSCMRVGIFSPDLVSTGAMWEALRGLSKTL